MIVRDPLIHATSYYLRAEAGESAARRAARRELFAEELRRVARQLAGWLALPAPQLPTLPTWEGDGPRTLQLVLEAQALQGPSGFSAALSAYVLRNMWLLRVIVARNGEYAPEVWEQLDAVLNGAPPAESWLHTVHYWCGMAPRPPEELAETRTQSVQATFGVLCLGHETQPHVLVYPDARARHRANAFLRTLAPRLDWYTVQARHRLSAYTDHAAIAARRQEQALERVSQAARLWEIPFPAWRLGTSALASFQAELSALETLHREVNEDLRHTRAVAAELHALADEYRLLVMQHGLWAAAPTVWEAETEALRALARQVETDTHHVEATLRRLDFLAHTFQARLAVRQSEQIRQLGVWGVALGAVLLGVMLASAELGQTLVRLVVLGALLALIGAAWWAWRTQNRPGAS